jgi:hypothetical protein
MSKTLDNFFVIVYNCNIKDVPFIAVVEKFWRTVDKEATQSPRIGEVIQ